MKERGYTGVRQTARELGVDPSQLDRWLNGVTSPSVSSCRHLSRVTGTPIERLVLMATIGSDDGDTHDPSA
jgi:transcriptional regulator with XRE-family HTH domain